MIFPGVIWGDHCFIVLEIFLHIRVREVHCGNKRCSFLLRSFISDKKDGGIECHKREFVPIWVYYNNFLIK